MSSSSEKLRAAMRERSAIRKELLKKTLGVNEGTSLAEALGNVHNRAQSKNDLPEISNITKAESPCDIKLEVSSTLLNDGRTTSEKSINKLRLSGETIYSADEANKPAPQE